MKTCIEKETTVISLNPKDLLFIEPKNKPTTKVNDELTKILEEEFENATEIGPYCKGFHFCICGKHSTNHDYKLPCGLIVNSLCVHYIRDHREEVPESELEKIRSIKK